MGIAPLETELRYETNFAPASSPNFTYMGPADLGFAAGEEPDSWNVTATEPGIYTFHLEAFDDQGDAYTDEIAFLAIDKTFLDNLLQVKWNSMKSALLQNKIEDALDFFEGRSQSAYRNNFQLLANEGLLVQAIEKMGLMRLVEYDGYGVIYDMRTTKDNTEYSFQVLFVQDNNGIWKILNF